MLNTISDTISFLKPISLHEMDAVALQDRIDTKYAFHVNELPDIINKASVAYNILEIDNKRISRYESVYFDTKDFKLYLQHHNGKANRFKFRYRKYMDSNLCFFEIKFKNNKSRTIKNRIKCDDILPSMNIKAEDIIKDKFLLDSSDFFPVVWVYYSRITLVNKTSKERLTIDIGLNFKNKEKSISIPSLVIAEVKQEKNTNSFFTKLMKENHIQQMSMSKYCLGIIKLYDNIKINNFKSKLIKLNKICYV